MFTLLHPKQTSRGSWGLCDSSNLNGVCANLGLDASLRATLCAALPTDAIEEPSSRHYLHCATLPSFQNLLLLSFTLTIRTETVANPEALPCPHPISPCATHVVSTLEWGVNVVFRFLLKPGKADSDIARLRTLLTTLVDGASWAAYTPATHPDIIPLLNNFVVTYGGHGVDLRGKPVADTSTPLPGECWRCCSSSPQGRGNLAVKVRSSELPSPRCSRCLLCETSASSSCRWRKSCLQA